jgi:hypothetical protein
MIRIKSKIVDYTPEERLNRVIEILADAVFRAMLTEQTGTAKGRMNHRGTSISCIPRLPQKGPVPFGQRIAEEGVEEDPDEKRLIRLIQRLAAKGYSVDKIAKRLNQEDKKSRRAGTWSRTAIWRILKSLKNG